MRAFLEAHAGTIRVGADGAAYGDPFEWACGVTFLPNGEAWLHGADRPVTPAIWRAVGELLQANGVRVAVWERRKQGQAPRQVRAKVKGDA